MGNKNDLVNMEVSYKSATGKMRYTLTNDYLFRATLQKSKKALMGLISAVLGMRPENILSVEIMNPIELGESIEAKNFILDAKVLLNNKSVINMEMQVVNYDNWPERSLAYLCRSFDELYRGQDYLEAKPVIQVSFLDFTLFTEYPEFFATYMFVNIKNHLIYSDKLKMLVVDLTCIDKATEEDKAQGIEHWARLFKATTWEEIRMLAVNNSFMEEAAETVYQLSAEEKIRMQCEAREDFYRQQRYMVKKAERVDELEAYNAALQESNAALQESNAALQENNVALQESNATLQESNAALQENNIALQESNSALQKSNAEKDEEIARLMRIIEEQKNK